MAPPEVLEKLVTPAPRDLEGIAAQLDLADPPAPLEILALQDALAHADRLARLDYPGALALLEVWVSPDPVDPLDPLALQENKENKAAPVLVEEADPGVLLDHLGHLALLVLGVRTDLLDHPDYKGKEEKEVAQAQQELLADLDPLAHLDHVENVDLMDPPDHLAAQVPLDKGVGPDQQERLVSPDHLAHLGVKDNRYLFSDISELSDPNNLNNLAVKPI